MSQGGSFARECSWGGAALGTKAGRGEGWNPRREQRAYGQQGQKSQGERPALGIPACKRLNAQAAARGGKGQAAPLPSQVTWKQTLQQPQSSLSRRGSHQAYEHNRQPCEVERGAAQGAKCTGGATQAAAGPESAGPPPVALWRGQQPGATRTDAHTGSPTKDQGPERHLLWKGFMLSNSR